MKQSCAGISRGDCACECMLMGWRLSTDQQTTPSVSDDISDMTFQIMSMSVKNDDEM